jgi:tRNA nucleotidyltransferase (CCA-adding enzyme)
LLAALGDYPGVYVVGGAVRDLLLGREPPELDLVVDGDARALAERLGGELTLHDRFGTSTVRLDGQRYDIARARSETYARPGALPDVRPASLDEDLRRRDFTVNAIALALGGAEKGRLKAAPHAFEDLGERLLRVLHDRSFSDDPTRLLRLARYASRLSFGVEPHTRELVEQAIRGQALSTVSGARVGAELRLLAREPSPLAAFASLAELGLDHAIEPGFGIADMELAQRAFELLPSDGRPDLLALMCASLRLDPVALRELLDRLSFEAGDRDAIITAVARARDLAAKLEQAGSPSEIAAAVDGAAPELVALAGAMGGAGAAAAEWLERLRQVTLEIDGGDLLAAGVPEGPQIGEGLQAALAAKLDGRVAGRDQELSTAREAVRQRRD